MKVDLKLTGKNFAPDLKHLNCQEVDKQHFAIQNGSSIIGLCLHARYYFSVFLCLLAKQNKIK